MKFNAAWLLERLNLDPAIAGDLLEERANGRSGAWYWTQVSGVICINLWSGIRDHKLLALRAVAFGCAMNYGFHLLVVEFLAARLNLPEFAWYFIVLLTEILAGWVVARTHRALPMPMVVAFVMWLVLWFAGNLALDAEAGRLLLNSIDQPRFRPYFGWYLARYVMMISTEVAGLLLGGIAGTRPTTALNGK
jgi:hypothetical protein